MFIVCDSLSPSGIRLGFWPIIKRVVFRVAVRQCSLAQPASVPRKKRPRKVGMTRWRRIGTGPDSGQAVEANDEDPRLMGVDEKFSGW